MPKLMVAIVTGAFALVIGFTAGALLTRPDNIIMEKLVNEKKTLQEELDLSVDEKTELRSQLSKQQEEEDRLKNELLNALREKRISEY